MALKDKIKFQFKRINPFQGLVIDADSWKDAHEYHRNQQKFHQLIFHRTGIIEGLRVTANSTPDLSVIVQPGIAIDPEGDVIIVPEEQKYQIKSRNRALIYLTIQFREILVEPYQPAENGQPTRIMEAYRIREEEKLPNESYLELARIQFDPELKIITNPKNPSSPKTNEINSSYRKEEKDAIVEQASAPVKKPKSAPLSTVMLGHLALGGADKNLHVVGLRNLVRDINRQGSAVVSLAENIRIDKNINQYALLYLVGNKQFELSSTQQEHLNSFLDSGGVIFAEGCSAGREATDIKGTKAFGLAFNQLAKQFNRKLEIVQRGHTLLNALYVFSEVPQGAEPAMLLEGNNMIYSASDYGCAWQGGQQNNPLPRDIIRSSFEIGTNILFQD